MPCLKDPDFVRRCLEDAMRSPASPADPDLPEVAASVAVIIQVDPQHGPTTLWIQRAENERDPWSGHMGFPGGKQESGDRHSRDTAERETEEELGLDLGSSAAYLGALQEQLVFNRTGRAPFKLAAHAYWLEVPKDLTPDPSEVAAVHPISMEYLGNPAHATKKQILWQEKPMSFPAVRFQDRMIWGLSLRIWLDLRRRLGHTEMSPLLTPDSL